MDPSIAARGRMTISADAINDLTGKIIACAITVHTQLGPGLLESVYQDCLAIELAAAKLPVTVGGSVPIVYRGKRVRGDLKLDLVVEKSVIARSKRSRTSTPYTWRS